MTICLKISRLWRAGSPGVTAYLSAGILGFLPADRQYQLHSAAGIDGDAQPLFGNWQWPNWPAAVIGKLTNPTRFQ